jgi:hypothetical protein
VFWTFWFETTIFLFIGLRQFGQLLREFSCPRPSSSKNLKLKTFMDRACNICFL